MSFEGAITDSDVLDGLSVKYLKFFGLWGVINDYRTTGKRNAIIKFKVLATILLAVPYLLCQYLSYFIITVDVQKVTFLNLHSLPVLQVYNKVLVFWFNMESFCRLFSLIRKDFLKTIPEYKRAEAREIYLRITKRCNNLCKAAFAVNTSMVIISVADPGVPVDYVPHRTGSMFAVSGSRKILCAWYPLPMAQSPYYEVIFVYETILAVWTGFMLAVYVCLFYQVLMCLYAQFSVLGYHISSLKTEDAVNSDKGSTNEHQDSEMYKELYAIIQDHKKLLSYANELRNVYNPLVTMVLGIGILVLIVGVFKFLFGETLNPVFIFKASQFLIYQGIEVSMFCFGSSFIETASSDLQFAIYSSDWYKADTKFRKAAQMMMLRARKGMTLTAIKMYPVNLETIMAILQFTYSMTTLLSRMTIETA